MLRSQDARGVGSLVELVRTTTADGLRLDGALAVPAGDVQSFAGRCDALLCLHGVGGNFYSGGLFEEVSPPLLAAGLAVLRVNTRGRDGFYFAPSLRHRRHFGSAYEVVDECQLDLAAWLEFLVLRGYGRIGLFGHSLGAVKSLYAQSMARRDEVTCVVAASPPRLSSACYLEGAERERFEPLLLEAEQHVAAGRGETLMQVRFPFPLLISAATYVDKYGRENRYDILTHAPRVGVDTLFVYAENELRTGGSAFAELPQKLGKLEYAGPAPAFTIVEGADHMYTGRRRELASAALRWLRG